MPLLILWLHTFIKNYFERKESYAAAMVEMFKTIPKNDGIPMTSREFFFKLQILLVDGIWKNIKRDSHL